MPKQLEIKISVSDYENGTCEFCGKEAQRILYITAYDENSPYRIVGIWICLYCLEEISAFFKKLTGRG
mgnify:CR=1 FL=1